MQLLLAIALLTLPLPGAPAVGGFLTGSIREHAGAGIPNVEIQVENEGTGSRQRLVSGHEGRFTTPELTPGEYRLTLRRRGFRTASFGGLTVRAGETRAGDFVMELIPLQQEITVQSARDTTDPAGSGLAVTRTSSERELPANGRDLHAFYAFVPGASTTPASSSDGGQFSVNGQRPNTNTVRVDGINANTGLGISVLPGTYPGSSLPAMTAIGSTQSVAAEDEMERVELRSSDFSPETGERPGAEIRIETRAGSNDFHGSGFGLFRPQSLDSEDWLALKYNAPLVPSSLNGYGGSLGGAFVPNRTFFFLAAEQEQVRDTAFQLMATPSMRVRAEASSGIGLLLNAFPMPIGSDLGGGTALGSAALEQRASVENYSARIDQIVGSNGRMFARFSDVPSRSATQQLGEIDAGLRSLSLTLGMAGAWLGAVHDLRFNYTKASAASTWTDTSPAQQAAFGAFPNQLPPNGNGYAILGSGVQFGQGYLYGGTAALAIAGVGQLAAGTGSRATQEQAEGVYNYSRERGRHDVRLGADYLLLVPSTPLGGAAVTAAVSAGVGPLLAGDPLGLTYSGGKPTIYREDISIGAVSAQDTFRVSDRLTLLYGLRWDLAFPTSAAASSTSIEGIAVWDGPGAPTTVIGPGANLNERTWSRSYKELAPRLGVAYRLPALRLVFRAGGGIFHETALGSLINPVNFSTLSSWQYLPVSGRAVPPSLFSSDTTPPQLFLPTVWEWRTSLERSIGDHSTASLAYSGSAGTRLLRLEGTVDPANGILRQSFFASDGFSRYEALEAQLRGRLTSSLSSLISYTWGHSIDNGSQVSAVYLTQPGYSPALDRGSSDFDVRQNFNAALSYHLPAVFTGRRQNWLKNWDLSSSFEARSGFPFDVTTVDRSIGLGFANTGRADLVSGRPLWVGGKLNPNAFRAPVPGATNGTLGRNDLTGPGLFQVDASLRRQFRLFERASLEASVSAFNLFNRASFSNPEAYLGSPLFGQALSMQSLMMGSGNPTNGLAPIFQAGGPRTVEIGFRISF